MPLRIIIEPRVVMKEGIRSFVVTMPLRAPTPMHPTSGRKNAKKGFSERRGEAVQDRGKRKYRSHGQVELSGNHQQRDTDGHDAELGKDVQDHPEIVQADETGERI